MANSFRIGDWQVEPSLNSLERNSESHPLEPRAMEVLVYLAEHTQEVISKERLIQDIWEGAFVTDEALTYAVHQIRKALGDDAKEPRFIQTVPKRGYRLVAPVRWERGRGFTDDERISPYPGLAPFSEEDAGFFFGRDEEVEAVWNKLRSIRLLAIIGPSGAGKTSFLRAGLIPSRPEGWRIVVCHPGDRPFVALGQALVPELSGDTEITQQLFRLDEWAVASSVLTRWRQSHAEVLLIVDPFEELFTLNPEEVQARFAELLGRAAGDTDLHVLLCMRDDFLMHCHDHPSLDPIFDRLTPLKTPSGPALRKALAAPAESCGYRFEDESLVADMLAEVARERGALPLLAFSASRLWAKRNREKKLLTREAYLEIEGVAGAIAKHAEATLERIGTEREPIVREIFRNLVTAKGTRAARDKEELLSVFDDRDAAEEVLRALIDARLLTSFEITARENPRHGVEIIHESLLTAWPRLVRWQTQDADSAQLRDQLRQTAQLWQERGRPVDLLWTGTSFREFGVWRERYPGGLTATEQDFARAMVDRTQRRRRRQRLAVGSVITLLVAVLALVGVSRQQAVTASRGAEASKLLALGQLELEHYPTAAVAYALKSLELSDTSEARLFALEALQKGPPALIMDTGTLYSQFLDFSPDGQWLAVGGYERVRIFPREGGAPISLPESPSTATPILPVEFSLEGTRLITSKTGNIRIFSFPEVEKLTAQQTEPALTLPFPGRDCFYTVSELEDGIVVRSWPLDGSEPSVVGQMELDGTGKSVWGKYNVAIDPTGKWLSFAQGRKIFLRSLEDWNRPPRLLGEHSDQVLGEAELSDFDGHGELLATRDVSGEVRVWSVGTSANQPVRVFDSREGYLILDESGDRLAEFSNPEYRATAKIWSLTGPLEAEPLLLLRDVEYVNDAAFEPSGRWLATGNADFGVAFWPLVRDYPLVLKGHGMGVFGLAFTPDGKSLVSASMDGTMRLWSLEGREPMRVLLRSEDFVYPGIDIDASGEQVLVSAHRGKVFLVQLEGGPPRRLEGFSTDSYLLPVAFSPDGRYVAAAPWRSPKDEKFIRVWDLESGESRVLGPLEGAGDGTDGSYWSIHFLSESRLLSAGAEGLRVWDLENHSTHLLVSGILLASALSSDGRHVLCRECSAVDPSAAWCRVERYDVASGNLKTLDSHGSAITTVAFDPSGNLAVTGDEDGVVRVGPVTGEAPHLLFGHQGSVTALAVSPDGRWIASAGVDYTIRLWPIPDMDEPPFHTLPYEELLTRLRIVTNLRVVEDEASATGYRLDTEPFPGWETVPHW